MNKFTIAPKPSKKKLKDVQKKYEKTEIEKAKMVADEQALKREREIFRLQTEHLAKEKERVYENAEHMRLIHENLAFFPDVDQQWYEETVLQRPPVEAVEALPEFNLNGQKSDSEIQESRRQPNALTEFNLNGQKSESEIQESKRKLKNPNTERGQSNAIKPLGERKMTGGSRAKSEVNKPIGLTLSARVAAPKPALKQEPYNKPRERKL
jgi:hypothetical protein